MPYEKEIQILSELRSEYNCFDPNEREYYHALSEAISSLKNNRHGHWIDHQYKEFPIGRYWCSVCGAKHDMEWDYCPNCGAKMDEEKNDDDTVYMMGDEHCVFKYSKGERKEDGLLVTDKN